MPSPNRFHRVWMSVQGGRIRWYGAYQTRRVGDRVEYRPWPGITPPTQISVPYSFVDSGRVVTDSTKVILMALGKLINHDSLGAVEMLEDTTRWWRNVPPIGLLAAWDQGTLQVRGGTQRSREILWWYLSTLRYWMMTIGEHTSPGVWVDQMSLPLPEGIVEVTPSNVVSSAQAVPVTPASPRDRFLLRLARANTWLWRERYSEDTVERAAFLGNLQNLQREVSGSNTRSDETLSEYWRRVTRTYETWWANRRDIRSRPSMVISPVRSWEQLEREVEARYGPIQYGDEGASITIGTVTLDAEPDFPDGRRREVVLGPFTITFAPRDSYPTSWISISSEGPRIGSYSHPHVCGTSPCWGAAQGPVNVAWEEGQYAEAFDAIVRMLKTYTGEGFYEPLKSWLPEEAHDIECQRCDARVDSHDLYYCSSCGYDVCTDCYLDDELCMSCGRLCAECGLVFDVSEEDGDRCSICVEQASAEESINESEEESQSVHVAVATDSVAEVHVPVQSGEW